MLKQESHRKNEVSEPEPPVPFFTLFKYSSLWDKILMSVASLVAVSFGVLWPMVMILSGSVVGQFVNHASNASTNSTGKNESLQSEDFLKDMATLCLEYVIVGIFIFSFNYIVVCFFSLTAANQAHKIQSLFMASILKQDIAWFDTHHNGDFSSRLTSDLGRIQDGIGEKLGICITLLSSSIFCGICGIYYGWKLALVTLSVTPILTVAQAILSKVQAAASGEELQAQSAAGSVAEEVLSSIRTVVAFGGERKEIERYDKCLIPAERKGIKRGMMTSIGSGLTWFCIFGGYALSFWYGVKLVVDEKDEEKPEYTASTLIIVFNSIISGSMFIGRTSPYFEGFAQARGAAAKIFSIIERKPSINSSSKLGEKPPILDGSISLKNVHFKYPARPDVQILKDISFTIKPGETVALVGPSGCGKSTIVQLILRFYDTDEGSVEIDGNNVKVLNVGWLRENIGFVGQEPVLFSTTIAENIRFGKSDAAMDEIENAAKLANVHDFISGLPLKYDTLVGDRGTQLSGGQKQRVAVARALIKNPKILLLDEATSALDSASEAVVQSSLDQARKGRTTIIVAHRLSTIRNADKILVLADGAIQEVGDHEQLMSKKGIYFQLVLSQMNERDDEVEDLAEIGTKFHRSTSVLNSESQTSENLDHDFIRHAISSSALHEDEKPKGPYYKFKLYFLYYYIFAFCQSNIIIKHCCTQNCYQNAK